MYLLPPIYYLLISALHTPRLYNTSMYLLPPAYYLLISTLHTTIRARYQVQCNTIISFDHGVIFFFRFFLLPKSILSTNQPSQLMTGGKKPGYS